MNESVTLQEGNVRVVFPTDDTVYFNRHDRVVRDFKVLVAETFSRTYQRRTADRPWMLYNWDESAEEAGERGATPLRLLDACAGTGVSGLRFMRELSRPVAGFFCESSPEAYENVKVNIAFNDCKSATPIPSDCRRIMSLHSDPKLQFDIIDLDPARHPLRYTKNALRAITDGGLLLLRSLSLKAVPTFVADRQYGERLQRDDEARLVLMHLERAAFEEDRTIKPLFYFSFNGGLLLAVTVTKRCTNDEHVHDRVKLSYMCRRCKTFVLHPLSVATRDGRQPADAGPTDCGVCGNGLELAGRVWDGPLMNNDFVRQMHTIFTRERHFMTGNYRAKLIHDFLTVMKDEVTHGNHFNVGDLEEAVRWDLLTPLQFCNVLKQAGYEASPSHGSPYTFWTTAPTDGVWDVVHHWLCRRGPNRSEVRKSSFTEVIMARHPRVIPRMDFLATMKKTHRLEELLFSLSHCRYYPIARAVRRSRHAEAGMDGVDGNTAMDEEGGNAAEDEEGRNVAMDGEDGKD